MQATGRVTASGGVMVTTNVVVMSVVVKGVISKRLIDDDADTMLLCDIKISIDSCGLLIDYVILDG